MSKQNSSMIEFSIDHLDPLAQGVSRHEESPLFIPKTLPGETGHCKIYKKAKGVLFSYPLDRSLLKKSSELRTNSPCPHYDLCSGCHYLHTSYQNEVTFKLSALKKYLRNLINEDFPIKIHEASKRLKYRNRIQLHYSKKGQTLGYIDRFTNRIIEVPHCQLGNELVEAEFRRRYQERNWINKLKEESGHIEIYEQDGTLLVSENRAYADGGFTQVNQEMNQKILSVINSFFPSPFNQKITILDLFGGDGNLSAKIPFSSCLVVDSVSRNQLKNSAQKFLKVDLYEKDSWKVLIGREELKELDLLLIDPPRAGYADLTTLVEVLKPKRILYVSCNSATLRRDLLGISSLYNFNSVHLIDLFPSTMHFESLVFLEQKGPK